jgi:spectinomycin phosphotransferase
MLEPPGIQEARLLAGLRDEYGLPAEQAAFLPLGADLNTAVYRVSAGKKEYFLKLRKRNFNEISVALPHFLHQAGIAAIIPPLLTTTGSLWATLDAYRMVLYPYIAGQDGYERELSPEQWHTFGNALGKLHEIGLPSGLSETFSHEDTSSHWRMQVRAYQHQVENEKYSDPVSAELAGFLRTRWGEISQLVKTAEALALDLQAHPRPKVLCHGDIHPGNLHLPDDDRAGLFIVDWDDPVYAPRERDLALIGGCFAWRGKAEAALFYQGYTAASGAVKPEIDTEALTYYRCERILTDIALFCQQIFDTTGAGEDRAQALRYLTSSFLPEHEAELALQAAG